MDNFTNLNDLKSFATESGSTIRILAEPAQNLTLAEGIVYPAKETYSHYHHKTEEIYYFIAGTGNCASTMLSSTYGRGTAR